MAKSVTSRGRRLWRGDPSKAVLALLAKADAYAARAGRKRSSVSLYICNDGKTLDALAAGSDIMTRVLERANAELDRRIAALGSAPAKPTRRKRASTKT